MNPNPLSPERATQIGVSLTRWSEIGTGKIIDPRSEAEVAGLRNFFSSVMVEHGNELLACWLAVRSEYEPLIQVIERIGQRIAGIKAARAAEQAKPEEKKND